MEAINKEEYRIIGQNWVRNSIAFNAVWHFNFVQDLLSVTFGEISAFFAPREKNCIWCFQRILNFVLFRVGYVSFWRLVCGIYLHKLKLWGSWLLFFHSKPLPSEQISSSSFCRCKVLFGFHFEWKRGLFDQATPSRWLFCLPLPSCEPFQLCWGPIVRIPKFWTKGGSVG